MCIFLLTQDGVNNCVSKEEGEVTYFGEIVIQLESTNDHCKMKESTK